MESPGVCLSAPFSLFPIPYSLFPSSYFPFAVYTAASMVRATFAFLSLLLMVDSPSTRFDLAIRHARVVHGDGRVTPHATVFIAGGRIATDRLRPTRPTPCRPTAASRPRAARCCRASSTRTSTWSRWTLPLFLKYGVTSVRDVHNDPSYIFPLVRGEGPARPACRRGRRVARRAGQLLEERARRHRHGVGARGGAVRGRSRGRGHQDLHAAAAGRRRRDRAARRGPAACRSPRISARRPRPRRQCSV